MEDKRQERRRQIGKGNKTQALYSKELVVRNHKEHLLYTR